MPHWLAVLLTIILCFMGLTFFLGSYSYGQGIQQPQDLKPYVTQQIQRYGGLTPQAQETIQKYIKANYPNDFSVISESGNNAEPYGTVINYKITGTIKVPFFHIPIKELTVEGTGQSLIR